MAIQEFDDDNFIRTGGGVTFEERAAQPSDFTAERKWTYADIYAQNGDQLFQKAFPKWQAFADCFVVRRPVIRISGKQTCSTESFRANDLDRYVDPGYVKIKNFKIKGSTRSTIPRGYYQLVNINFSDVDGLTTITVEYQQYGEWELFQLRDAPVPGEGISE